MKEFNNDLPKLECFLNQVLHVIKQKEMQFVYAHGLPLSRLKIFIMYSISLCHFGILSARMSNEIFGFLSFDLEKIHLLQYYSRKQNNILSIMPSLFYIKSL